MRIARTTVLCMVATLVNLGLWFAWSNCPFEPLDLSKSALDLSLLQSSVPNWTATASSPTPSPQPNPTPSNLSAYPSKDQELAPTPFASELPEALFLYAQWHATARNNPKSKFLIFEGLMENGLGNNLLSFVSTALLAWATERVLIVSPPAAKRWGHIFGPDHGVDWLSFPDHLRSVEFNLAKTEIWDLSHRARNDPKYFFHILCGDVVLLSQSSQNVVRIRSDQYFASIIAATTNKVLKSRFDTAFGKVRSRLFGVLLTFFVKPHVAIVREARRQMQWFHGASEQKNRVVGVQMRTFPGSQDHLFRQGLIEIQQRQDTFFACASKLQTLCCVWSGRHGRARLPQEAKSRLVLAIEVNCATEKRKLAAAEALQAQMPASDDWKVLVATDHAPLLDSARVALGWDRVRDISLEHLPDLQQTRDGHALLTIVMLSMADALVVTAGSTFGNVAHGLANLRPFSVFGQGQGSCMQEPTSEPIFHLMTAATPKCDNQALRTDPHLLPAWRWADLAFEGRPLHKLFVMNPPKKC